MARAMIISASRRTDIPAYYTPWLLERLKEGYALVRNPMNPRKVSRVSLEPEHVDAIVFWTKDPRPLLPRLGELKEYMYYFQFTLNAYGRDVEPGLPAKEEVLVPAFQRLAEQIGPERVIWRYDPIFLSGAYTEEYHLRAFEALASRLAPYTKQCTISFLDIYRNTAKNMAGLALQGFGAARQAELAKTLAGVAGAYGLKIATCAEALDLESCGVGHARCIDAELIGRLVGCPISAPKDKNQRPACGCAESVDIGAYDTCPGGCRYCYANHRGAAPRQNMRACIPGAPLLGAPLGAEDVVAERKIRSYRQGQLQFGG